MSELEIWNELGNIYFKNEAYDEAIRTYQKAIELDHGSGQSYSNLASIYVRKGRYTEAILMLQKGIELTEEAGSKAMLWNQLGEAYRRLEDYDNAIACYRKAAELDPENTAFQDNLAEAELDLQRLDSQTGTGRPAPATASWVFKNQGLVYPAERESSEPPEAHPVVLGSRLLTETSGLEDEDLPASQAQGKAPTNDRVDGLLRLGIKHWRKKEYERAIQFLQTALGSVVRPKDNLLEALCYNAIALVETDLGKIVEAIQAYQSAASLAPEHIFPWNSLGNLNCMLDRYDDALAAFKEGIEHNPKDSVSWNGLGDVYHKLGRFEDAIAAYQLGNVFEKQELEEDILKAYEKSVEASRKNPDVWNEAGNIYYHTGAYEDAIAAYRKAIELDPANATFPANLAKARQALKQANKQNEAVRPEGKIMPPAASARAEQNHEDENIPAKLPSLPNRTAEHASEAPYWLFETEQASDKVLEPAESYCSVSVPAVVSTLKTLPTYGMPSRREQAYSGGHAGLPDTQRDASALLVQLTPRPASPARLIPGNPPPPAEAPADQAADQTPVNSSVLENDIARYRKITEMNPRNDRAWDALGNMYEAAGLHSEAIAAFEQAIELAPQKEAYHFHLGIALAYQMHYEKAILALQNSVAINPNFVLGHCALAANYRRIGKETEAQDHIAIARPSMEFEKEYNRACFEAISGNTDQAFALLETALEKGQVQVAMLRSDTDLDFIRQDARFEALLYKAMSVAQ